MTEREYDELLKGRNTDVAEMMKALRGIPRAQRHDGLSRDDGQPPDGAAPRAQADRLALSPLRPDCLALSEDRARWGVREGDLRNEIIWKRTSDAQRQQDVRAASHDIILLLHEGTNEYYLEHSSARSISRRLSASKYRYDAQRWSRAVSPRQHDEPESAPNLMYEWQGLRPYPNGGRFDGRAMEQLDSEGDVSIPTKDPMDYEESAIETLSWTRRRAALWQPFGTTFRRSTRRLRNASATRHKSRSRCWSASFTASSNEGDVVLDPFCGCGTAVRRGAETQAQMDRHRHHPPRDLADRKAAERPLQRPAAKFEVHGHAERPGGGARSGEPRQVSIPVVGGLAGGSAAVPGQKERRGHGHRRHKILPRPRPQRSAQDRRQREGRRDQAG